MKKANKLKRTKHGASSIFLAVILSALILVECTFVAFVWNLNYALSVNTALKTQIDTIMSDYNRQLFSVYGVYAFSIDGIDDECFNKALEINGLEAQSTLYVSNAQRITTEDLKKAVNSYYSYRATGVTLKGLVDGYGQLLVELDDKGILSAIGEYMQSPAAGYVSEIIKGDETASEWIEKAGDVLDIEEIAEEIADIDEIREEFSEAIHDSDIGIDIDITDWEGFLDALVVLESTIDTYADTAPDMESKFYVAHYCAYNFDCHFPPNGDGTINGTEFDSIHSERSMDAEYFITGSYGEGSSFAVYEMMDLLIILGKIAEDYADEKIRNTVYAVAEVISAIISAVSEGAADIDPRIIMVGLMIIIANIQSLKEIWSVFNGGRAEVFKYDGETILTMGYRDFLYLFCLFVPEETLLERVLEVLERDYGELYKGITLEADFRGSTYTLTKSYQLYE